MRAADVVLVPSMAEGMPNVLLEASACGRPVFGSAVGGIPEAIVHGQTGLLLPPGDVNAWRDAVREYASKPEQVAAMGRAARLLVEKKFDSSQYAGEILQMYEAAVANCCNARK